MSIQTWRKLRRINKIGLAVVVGGAVPAGLVDYTLSSDWQTVSFGVLCLGVGHFVGTWQKHQQILSVFRKHYGLQVQDWNVTEDGGLKLDA